jgi:hypothetical protein
MIYDNPNLTPSEDKEPEYTNCENCNEGFIYWHDEDGDLIKEKCEYCENGLIEIN